VEFKLFSILVGDFLEIGVFGKYYFFVIFLEEGFLLTDYPQFLENLIVFVSEGLQLVHFCSQTADLLLVELEFILIFEQ